jgi:hypothetical protein
MARVLTAPELAYLRSENQVAKLYLATLTPDTVYTARLNGIPASDDEVATITYDGGAGTPGDTRAAMSVYVGSTAGAYDKGSVRLREAISAASGTMKVGELSDVNWADNDYLTIVREFLLRPRHLRIDSDGVVYMDYEITFSTPTYNPHVYPAPIPIIGSHAVAWLSGGSASVLFDASQSYTVGGAGAMTYAWSVEPSGTASWDDDTSATPTLTVTAADTYTIECTVTWTYSAGGQAVSTTTYRHVFAFDANHLPMEVFKLNSCVGDQSSGGWSFNVTAYDEATRSEIRDQALCVLFAVDRYGSTERSIGPLISDSTPIRENIIAWGWITGESIQWNPEQGLVTFDVQGPMHWLGLMEGFPSGIEDVATTPAAWIQYSDLTPRAGAALFWLWRSTGPQVMDAFIFPDSVVAAGANPTALSEGDERQISVFDAPPTTLGRQINTVVGEAVRAKAICDRYGRLWVQRDLNEILEADRVAGNAPTVMTLTAVDWRDIIFIERRTIPPVSMLDMSGVAYKDGSAGALFSLAPGHVFKRLGAAQKIERLALWTGGSAQALANALCGTILGKMNNEYPVVETALAANNRAFDIAPWQYASLEVAEGDTERGISGTFTLIPRRVSFNHDPEAGVLLTDIEWENWSTPLDGITGDPPPAPPPPTPTLPPSAPPPLPTPPSGITMILMSQDQLYFSSNALDGSPTWVEVGPDPGGAVSGGDTYYRNAVLFGVEVYISTAKSSGAVDADDGLYYCADISAAAPSWETVKLTTAARTETDYDGHFGALWYNGDVVCAMFHSDRNDIPTGETQCSCLCGEPGAEDWVEMPIYGHQQNIDCGAGTCPEFGMWGNSLYIYISGAGFASGGSKRPMIFRYNGSAITQYKDYWPELGANTYCKSVWDGYVFEKHNEDVYNSGWGSSVYIPAASNPQNDKGICCPAAGGDALWIDSVAGDLYLGADKVADADEFAIGADGGMAAFIPGSDTEVVWVRFDSAADASVILYTADITAVSPVWEDITGDITDWSGAKAGTVSAIVRISESESE